MRGTFCEVTLEAGKVGRGNRQEACTFVEASLDYGTALLLPAITAMHPSMQLINSAWSSSLAVSFTFIDNVRGYVGKHDPLGACPTGYGGACKLLPL